jgi:hypothetical protein
VGSRTQRVSREIFLPINALNLFHELTGRSRSRHTSIKRFYQALASTIKRQTSGLPIIDLAGAHVHAGLVHPHLHFI